MPQYHQQHHHHQEASNTTQKTVQVARADKYTYQHCPDFRSTSFLLTFAYITPHHMSHRSLNPKPYCCLLFCCCCSAGFCCCSAMVLLLFCCGSAAVLLRPFSLQLSLLPGRALFSPAIPSPWQGPFLSNYPFSLAGPLSLQLFLLPGRALFSPTTPSPWQGPFLSNYPFSLAGSSIGLAFLGVLLQLSRQQTETQAAVQDFAYITPHHMSHRSLNQKF